MFSNDDREALKKIVEARALKRGDFTLASGKKSSYYLDTKQITLHSAGLKLVSQGLLDMLDLSAVDAVGGMSIGADPIVAGILSAAGQEGVELLGLMVRKEPKGHGTNKYVEGPVEPGMKVVIVEDVVTTGGSALKAVERVQEFGCEVTEVLAIIDRLEGGEAAFAEKGLKLRSLLTIEDFGITPPSN